MPNPALSSFFLGTPPSVVLLEMIEIDHPSFTGGPYRIVRNSTRGVTGVTHEDASGPHTYQYYPARLAPAGSENNLLQSVSVTLGDLSSIIQPEIEAVLTANNMDTKPSCTFRTYASNDLSAPLTFMALEIREITTSKDGASFTAEAPTTNESGVGEKYLTDRFPMLLTFV